MNGDFIKNAVNTMRNQGIRFEPGLTDRQVQAVEAAHAFCFPPDLLDLLTYALPIGERFPDWRDPRSESVLDQIAWPADSMCFDIEHNGFWLPSWGTRPSALNDAQARAREAVRDAPFLIPIYGHRYIPAIPHAAGNPVFSVYQTDIIHYGDDLPSYLFAEFGVLNPLLVPDTPREIVFWSELVRLNND